MALPSIMSNQPDDEDRRARRSTDPLIEMIAQKIGRMEDSMDKLTVAITKLAVIEEKQASDRQSLERAFASIEKGDERCAEMFAQADKRCAELFEKSLAKLESIDKRVDQLEREAPKNAMTSQWVIDGLKALAIVVAVFVLTKAGLMK